MKIQKSLIAPIIISTILFIIPFFWFKPGEMDLGGDATRLYFYDPLNYMLNQTLYNVLGSGIGGVALSYYAFPYMLLLKILKLLVDSPTILISIVNGVNLSVAFISSYFIVKELAHTKGNHHESSVLEYSAILAGFFYIFSPYLIAGWDRTILTHNQFFLNPLMFLLLLRYFTRKNVEYLLLALLVTFIFSPNFTYVAAPPFFAFYPLSLFFLCLYTKYIRKTSIPLKGLFFGLLVFIVLQSFHIIPHVLTILTPGSQMGKDVFSEWSRLSRGQDYFAAVAQTIKVSISFLNLSQGAKPDMLSYGFIVFPFIVLIGFMWGKIRPLSLTGIFFLITLFFATANITGLGFNLYKSLFYIPGFSMFRNYYGQWGFVFVFFYTLLIGQSLAIILGKLNKKLKYSLIIYIATLLTVSAWPFINGSLVHIDLFQTDHIKPVVRMDPEYEKVLNYVRNLPVDGKILSFPFTDPGYQIIAGKDGGAYVGPSTFSNLAGKSDFTGYSGLLPFSEFFLNAVRDNQFQSLHKLFSILNIRYVFYNSDSRIYDNSFPGFPYNFVRNFLPQDQASYKELVNQLPIYKKQSFGENYHLYLVEDDLYLPHIFTAPQTIYTNNPFMFFSVSGFNYSTRTAVFSIDNSHKNTATVILEAENNNPVFELKDNYHLHRHEPFVSIKPNSIFYPALVLKEKYELNNTKKDNAKYLDLSLLQLSKRVTELDKWGETMKIIKGDWSEPKMWQFYNWRNYNTWEGSLSRYKTGMEQLIRWIHSPDEEKKIKEANKIKVNEQLSQHRNTLTKKVRESIKKEEDKNYLLSLIEQTFSSLSNTLGFTDNIPSVTDYSLQIPQDRLGEYEVYLEKMDRDSDLLLQAYLMLDGKILKPIDVNSNSNFLRFDDVTLKNQGEIDFTLHLPLINLVKDSIWQNVGDVRNINEVTEFNIQNIPGDNSGGLSKELIGWKPNRQYLISFGYQTYGGDIKFILYDKKYNKLQKKIVRGNMFFEKNLNSENWKTQQSIVTSANDSSSAFMQVLGISEKTLSRFQIKNLSVVEIRYPRILFKKIVAQKVENSISPQITFSKVNPTKYIIKINNARDPFTLVFLEAFNHNWKLVNPDIKATSFKSKITNNLGMIGEKIIGLFIKNKQRNSDAVTSYFNGNVNEGQHTNIFLEPSTFETWGKESVAMSKHFPVYGYANAWTIDPQDMYGKTDYVLVLEMGTQKYFYLLLGIATLTAFCVLVYLLTRIFKKNEKSN